MSLITTKLITAAYQVIDNAQGAISVRNGQISAPVLSDTEKSYVVRGEDMAALRAATDAARDDADCPPATTPIPRIALTPGILAAHCERQRQISEEKWTPEHDDHHDQGEMTFAAICYADSETLLIAGIPFRSVAQTPKGWPWDADWWKPGPSPKRNLEKAMALLAAEWDRLDRLEQSGGPQLPGNPVRPQIEHVVGQFHRSPSNGDGGDLGQLGEGSAEPDPEHNGQGQGLPIDRAGG